MPALVIWIMGLIWGMIGAAFHQWHESETDNNSLDDWGRALFWGAVAGVLVVVIWSNLGFYGTIIAALGAGYSADSFILNIIRKKMNKEVSSGRIRKILEEIIEDILNKKGLP